MKIEQHSILKVTIIHKLYPIQQSSHKHQVNLLLRLSFSVFVSRFIEVDFVSVEYSSAGSVDSLG